MAQPVQPLADYGFFGPGTVTWKVWGHTTTPVTGLQRAVVVEELDPSLIAAVDATDLPLIRDAAGDFARVYPSPAVVVRPDGYLGYAGPADTDAITAYLKGTFA